MTVYLAERYREYYDGGNQLIGIFSTYEKAWQRIHEIIADNNNTTNLEYGHEIYSVGEFGVIGIELDKKINLE